MSRNKFPMDISMDAFVERVLETIEFMTEEQLNEVSLRADQEIIDRKYRKDDA